MLRRYEWMSDKAASIIHTLTGHRELHTANVTRREWNGCVLAGGIVSTIDQGLEFGVYIQWTVPFRCRGTALRSSECASCDYSFVDSVIGLELLGVPDLYRSAFS